MQASNPVNMTGRDYLQTQVTSANNPWKGALESLKKADQIAMDSLSQVLRGGMQYDFTTKRFVNTPDISQEDVDIDGEIQNRTKIYDDIRNAQLAKLVLHKPCKSLDEVSAILNFLKSKAKYPEGHKRYTRDDDWLVLTGRLDKLLKKAEEGTLLTLAQKTAKRNPTPTQR